MAANYLRQESRVRLPLFVFPAAQKRDWIHRPAGRLHCLIARLRPRGVAAKFSARRGSWHLHDLEQRRPWSSCRVEAW